LFDDAKVLSPRATFLRNRKKTQIFFLESYFLQGYAFVTEKLWTLVNFVSHFFRKISKLVQFADNSPAGWDGQQIQIP